MYEKNLIFFFSSVFDLHCLGPLGWIWAGHWGEGAWPPKGSLLRGQCSAAELWLVPPVACKSKISTHI